MLESGRRFVFLCAVVTIVFAITAKPATAQAIFRVTDFGAVGDGETMNTDAFASAIAACSAAGGGRVVVPTGTFLTGPIHLASNLDLHVDAGATVLFSHHYEDFPLTYANFEGRETVRCTSPIMGEDLQNISITGDGAFDGQGDFWRPAKKEKFTPEQWDKLLKSGGFLDKKKENWYPSEVASKGMTEINTLRDTSTTKPRIEDYARYRELLRPSLMLLSNCHNVLLNGPTFKNSPEWDIHLFVCDQVTVRNVNLWNPIYAQNGDGIDIDSCHNVTMTDSTVYAGDDNICLKSGRDEEGRKFAKPTENITISNCTMGWGHGGIAIGSEMSGGVRNVTVSNCIMLGTDAGLRFKTTRGRGGVVENIQINNIEMSNIQKAAITFDMFYMVKKATTEPVSERTPQFRQIRISNVNCEGAKQALVLRGLPELPIDEILIENTRLKASAAGEITDASNITLRDVRIHAPHSVRVTRTNNLTLERVEGIDPENHATTKPDPDVPPEPAKTDVSP